jgi:hypothetical protein
VVIGLVYEWKKGAFDWSEQAREEAIAEAAVLRKKKSGIFGRFRKAA